jgi:hypothetical protein
MKTKRIELLLKVELSAIEAGDMILADVARAERLQILDSI